MRDENNLLAPKILQGGWLKWKGGGHDMMPILLFVFPSVMQYYIIHNNNNAIISGSKLLLAHLTKQCQWQVPCMRSSIPCYYLLHADLLLRVYLTIDLTLVILTFFCLLHAQKSVKFVLLKYRGIASKRCRQNWCDMGSCNWTISVSRGEFMFASKSFPWKTIEPIITTHTNRH